MDICKNGYIINEDGTIPERCHVDWDDGFYPTVCKECPFYNSEYFMNTSEAINLLEVIKFCDVDELAKIKAIDMAIISLEEKEKIGCCKKCEDWKYERLWIGYKFCPYCGRVLDI